jgi:hypothetical protein
MIESQRKKQGFIPEYQPRWCRYCEHLVCSELEIPDHIIGKTRKKKFNLTCGIGKFPVRSQSSCNLFEVKEL